jgi:hypothetical protein
MKIYKSYTVHNQAYESNINADLPEKFRADGYKEVEKMVQEDPKKIIIRNGLMYPHINIGVDVGSGHGWLTEYFAMMCGYKKIFAIEPSKAAVEEAQRQAASSGWMYKTECEVHWIHAFAEDYLRSKEFAAEMSRINEPVHFWFSFVLTHLPHDIAASICQAINDVAPPGSVISFEEVWTAWFGNYESATGCWYVRTEEWWRSHFPGWTGTFNKLYHAGGGQSPWDAGEPAKQFKSFTLVNDTR